jgi:DNA (cytosine-5)-methyltransferase 1
MNNRRPIAIDLFAGAGGMSLGFEQAGFDVVAAVEIDPIHSATHKFNFPDCTILPRTVEGLTGEEIRHKAGIGDQDIDCVFGGAPCQGFSLIGHRAFDDPRNKLVGEFVRIVSELKAKAFVFENVKGLTVGKHKEFLNELVNSFQSRGYTIRQPWNVLNAAHYGVPQYRERLFLLGVRDGIQAPVYPKPSTTPADGRKLIRDLPLSPTVAEAIGDLPDADCFQILKSCDSVRTPAYGNLSAYATELRCLTNSAWHFGYPRNWQSDLMTSSARTDHTDISRRRFSETPQGETEAISRFYRLANDGVSNTLRAGTDGSRGAFTSPRPIHFKHNRCITVREMARLHGFPDWFRFNVTKWHGARQIGNAVPPPLARAVAVQIMQALGVEPQRPVQAVALGEEQLLQFDLSQASSYFGVEAPRHRRDKKSGSIKRKQIEIECERLVSERTATCG